MAESCGVDGVFLHYSLPNRPHGNTLFQLAQITTRSTVYVDLNYLSCRPARVFLYVNNSPLRIDQSPGKYERQKHALIDDSRGCQLAIKIKQRTYGLRSRREAAINRSYDAHAVGCGGASCSFVRCTKWRIPVAATPKDKCTAYCILHLVCRRMSLTAFRLKPCLVARIPSRHNLSSGSPKLSGSELAAGSVTPS